MNAMAFREREAWAGSGVCGLNILQKSVSTKGTGCGLILEGSGVTFGFATSFSL